MQGFWTPALLSFPLSRNPLPTHLYSHWKSLSPLDSHRTEKRSQCSPELGLIHIWSFLHTQDRGRKLYSKTWYLLLLRFEKRRDGTIENRFHLENKRAKDFRVAGSPVTNSLMFCGALVPGEFPSYNLFSLEFFGLQLAFNNL